jgi:serine/threonine protein kinase
MSAAAINDPGIVAVYDVGTQDGFPYVVSELLEGETLRDRLRTGALSRRRSVEYGIQIARALAAAHDKGIVHRDLKPENIFITRDGRIKILDFRLAKLTRQDEAAAAAGQTALPTAAVDTIPGMLLGTVGYMAPEQVRGLPADDRSDIFALGAILYEMLSGRRAFRGATVADTMSAILNEDPPELVETRRDIPPAVERIVRHCLDKNPEERFRSAHDVAFALESVSHTSQSSMAIQPGRQVAWLAAWKPILGALAIAAIAAGTFLSWRATRRSSLPTF